MDHSEVISYVKKWASELNQIAHTDANKRFFYNIDEFSEAEDQIKGYDDYALVMEDRHRGRLGGNEDNIRDIPQYGFFIMKRVKNGIYESEEAVFQDCKALAFKFRARLRKDTHEEVNSIARFVSTDSFTYRRVGPELESWHGCELTWELSNNVNDEIIYDPADYTIIPDSYENVKSVKLSQADYDALGAYYKDTFYLIEENEAIVRVYLGDTLVIMVGEPENMFKDGLFNVDGQFKINENLNLT